MKHIFLFITILFVFSCGKNKVVLLPEISHSEITEIKDVSPAYLFYNETKKDSVELNRKNLIVTTNWLVNIDRRLTLKQVIPHIKFLQDKKRNSSHKNEKAKNYFTCNDISRKNLGFVEFTNVAYKSYFNNETSKKNTDSIYLSASIHFKSLNSVTLNFSDGYCGTINTMEWKEFSNSDISDLKLLNDSISVSFDKNLSFQDYITFKVYLKKMKKEDIPISNNEFIFNYRGQ